VWGLSINNKDKTDMITFSDLVLAVLKLFPNAQVGENNNREIVIHTGLMTKDGKLVTFKGD
jgi:hypothetical protein